MKPGFTAGMVLLIALSGAALQFQIPLGTGSTPSPPERKGGRTTSRTLTGSVLDKSDQPVANAVVYLKNMKTLAVTTFIAQNDGGFRFPELSNNVDYEIYAQRDGKKSGTKTLSQFDDRAAPRINLRIDINK